LLKSEQVTLREGIRLGNDGNEVNAGTKTLHNLDVKWLETVMILQEALGRITEQPTCDRWA
jgi:hypothetical protein